MMKLIQKVQQFMAGRYGVDNLYRTGLIVGVLLSLAGTIMGNVGVNAIVSVAVSILGAGIMVCTVLRALSKDISRRSMENARYMVIENAVTGWFKLTARRFKERKTHVFRRCPKCKTPVRLQRVKGKHTARCPVCSEQFKVKIR